jgi:lipid-A-disaccharide synthase
MVVIFPLNNPEVIPLEGLADLIGKIPILGKLFKRWLAKTINQKTKYFALPNQKADKEIVPEIRGIISPFSVGQEVYALYKNKEKRAKMSNELILAMGPAGAAKKIWGMISAEL